MQLACVGLTVHGHELFTGDRAHVAALFTRAPVARTQHELLLQPPKWRGGDDAENPRGRATTSKLQGLFELINKLEKKN